MIDIKSPKCICGKSILSFGLPSDKIRKYCKICRTPDMINIVTPKCARGKSTPCFGLPTDTKAKYCTLCKTPDMIINIKHTKCFCWKAIPSFGLPPNDTKAKYCKSCKLDDMIDIKTLNVFVVINTLLWITN